MNITELNNCYKLHRTLERSGTNIVIYNAKNSMVQGLTIYGQSEVVEEAIKSAGDSGSIEIETCGKNLIDITKSADVVRPDGVTRNGLNFFGLNGIYTLSQGTGSSVFYYGVWDGNQWSKTGTIQTNTSETISLNATKSLWIWVAENQQMSQLISTAQLECGSIATAYEPYNGTMAVFSTGTPLRGIPDTDVRDVMQWDGSAREVTKNCGEVDLGTRIWTEYGSTAEYTRYVTGGIDDKAKDNANCLCAKYNSKLPAQSIEPNMVWISNGNAKLSITTNVNEYASASDFTAAMSGVKLVYELATPITAPLTTAEISQAENLQTFNPQTNVQNSSNAEMTIKYNRRAPN